MDKEVRHESCSESRLIKVYVIKSLSLRMISYLKSYVIAFY